MKNLKAAEIFCVFIKLIQQFCKLLHPSGPLFLHKAGTLFHGGHQQIGGGTGLINIQKTFQQSCIHPAGIHMEQSCLCQAGESFVQALYYDICTAFERRSGKSVGKGKMSPMGFIHNQRQIPGVHKVCNGLNVRYNAVISGGGNKHTVYLRKIIESLFHKNRGNGTGNTEFCSHRQQVNGL